MYNYPATSVWVQQNTATCLQTVCSHIPHIICTSGSFTNLACCCFKVRMKMQTLLGWFWPCLTSFTPNKLLYYFPATREQCRAQQDTAAGSQCWWRRGKLLCTDNIFCSSILKGFFFPKKNKGYKSCDDFCTGVPTKWNPINFNLRRSDT